MSHYIKCFKSLNLAVLSNHIISNFCSANNCDREFNQLYKWRSFKDGFEEAKITKKPIFLLIYKLWCPACIKLKEKCSKSIRLLDLSSQFVMIKVEVKKDAVVNNAKYQPDGQYVPRILFYDQNGDFIKEAYNRYGNTDNKHKYFYNNPAQIIETMLYVLKQYSTEPLPA